MLHVDLKKMLLDQIGSNRGQEPATQITVVGLWTGPLTRGPQCFMLNLRIGHVPFSYFCNSDVNLKKLNVACLIQGID